MEKTKSLFLSAFIALAFVFAGIMGFGITNRNQPVYADPPEFGNSVSLSATNDIAPVGAIGTGTPYLVNNELAASGTLGEGGCTAFMDIDNNVLKLKGYNYGPIAQLTANLSLKIDVDGTNNINITTADDLTLYGVWARSGLIEITSSTGGTLNINVTNTKTDRQAYVYGIAAGMANGETFGQVKFSGDVSVNIVVTNQSTHGLAKTMGISVYDGASFINSSDVSVDVTSSNNESNCAYAVYRLQNDTPIVFNTAGDIVFDNSKSVVTAGYNTLVSGSEYTFTNVNSMKCKFLEDSRGYGYETDFYEKNYVPEFAGGNIVRSEYVIGDVVTRTYKNKTTSTFDIIYYANGGSGTMSETPKAYSANYTLLANQFTAPTNKVFKCWNVAGPEKDPGTSIEIDCDKLITAVWTYPTMSNVQVSAQGVLSWDAIAGASSYYVLLITEHSNGSVTSNTNSCNIKERLREMQVQSQNIRYNLYARDGDEEQISQTYEGNWDYTTDQTKVATPTGLTWDGATAKWDAIEHADGYRIDFYEVDGNAFVTGNSVYGKTEYLSTSFDVDTAYYFTIYAMPHPTTGVDYCDSDTATSASKTFNHVVDSLAGHVTVSDTGVISVTDVAGAALVDYSIYSADGTTDYGGGSSNELPANIMEHCAKNLPSDGLYDIKIKIYNADSEPLAPEYLYENWEYDHTKAPVALTGTVTITGTTRVGQTLTATLTDSNATGTITYRWWRSDPSEGWVIVQNSTSNTFVITQPCVNKVINVIVETNEQVSQIESENTATIAPEVDLNVVSVGGNAVSADLGPGEFTNGSFPLGHVGEAYSATLVAEGGSGSYTWSILVGSFADGLSLDADTGVVSGTPTVTKTGSITVKVVDSYGVTDTVELNFFVAADDWAPVITTESVDNAVVDKSYSDIFECNHGVNDDIDWTLVSGTLPTGLVLGKQGAWDGRLSGTPTEAGTFVFTLKAENSYGSDTKEYTVVVDNPMTLSFPDGKYYKGDTVQLTASIGNANVTWTLGAHTSESTTISESGLLTIGNDEENTYYVTVVAVSKTNVNNGKNIMVEYEYTLGVPYSITVVGGVSQDSTENSISRAAQGEEVYVYAPAVAGKQFREWTVEAGSAEVTFANSHSNSTSFTMPSGNVSVKANYDIIISSVTATFDAPVNGQHVDKTLTTGSANYTATLNKIWYDSSVADIDELVYVTDGEYSFYVVFEAEEGYVLLENSELSVTINGNALSYGDDYIPGSGWRLTLTAASDAIPHYGVTVENGQASSTLAEADTTITITANAPTSGQVFDKWVSEDVDFVDENSATTTFVMPAKAVTVTATYKAITQYTVSFNSNGGSGEMVSEQVNEGETFELPTCLFVAPANKEFKCWLVNDTERAVGYEITVTANTTVYAVWKFITYTVSFNANGGSGEMANEQANKGSTYTLPSCTFTAPASKEFKCWEVNAENMNVGDGVVVNGDITVKAVWQDFSNEVNYSDSQASTGIDVKTLFDNAKANELGVTLNIGESKVTFNADAVNAIGGNANITFTMTTSNDVADAGVDGAQKVINISIGGFTAGSATVEIPFATAVPAGKLAKVYFVDTNGATTDMNATFENGKAIFTVTHFSKYVIAFINEQSQDSDIPTGDATANNGGLGAGAIVGIVIAVVIVGGVAAFAIVWFVVKKKKWSDFTALFKKKQSAPKVEKTEKKEQINTEENKETADKKQVENKKSAPKKTDIKKKGSK